MSIDDLPPVGRHLQGYTVPAGAICQDWFVWHPLKRCRRQVDAVLFSDGEVLVLTDDTPRSTWPPDARRALLPPSA